MQLSTQTSIAPNIACTLITSFIVVYCDEPPLNYPSDNPWATRETLEGTTLLGDTQQYRCIEGYRNEAVPSKGNRINLRCSDDGTWRNDNNQCICKLQIKLLIRREY